MDYWSYALFWILSNYKLEIKHSCIFQVWTQRYVLSSYIQKNIFQWTKRLIETRVVSCSKESIQQNLNDPWTKSSDIISQRRLTPAYKSSFLWSNRKLTVYLWTWMRKKNTEVWQRLKICLALNTRWTSGLIWPAIHFWYACISTPLRQARPRFGDFSYILKYYIHDILWINLFLFFRYILQLTLEAQRVKITREHKNPYIY